MIVKFKVNKSVINSKMSWPNNGGAYSLYQIKIDSCLKLTKIITSTNLDSSYIYFKNETENALYYLGEQSVVKHNLSDNQYSTVFSITPSNPFYNLNDFFVYQHLCIGVTQLGFVTYDTKRKEFNAFELLQPDNNEVIKGGFCNDRSFFLYSSKTLYSIPFTYINTLNQNPTIYFSDIQTNLEIANKTDTSCILKYSHDNTLAISFTAFNLNKSETKNWTCYINKNTGESEFTKSIDQHTIQLNNLQYGKYTVKIYFANNFIKKYSFELLPKWYQTNTSKFLFYLAILISCLKIMYFLFKRYHLRKSNLLKNRFNILQLESSAKLNQLKPHFIFNAITPLQNYIYKQENPKAIIYLNNFSTLLRQMINMSREPFVSIQKEIDFNDNFAKFKLEENAYNFDYSIIIDLKDEFLYNCKIPSLMIQPLLENAISYCSVDAVEIKPSIRVEYTCSDYQLFIVKVIDNGKGFELKDFNVLKKNNALQIIQERLITLKKQFKNINIGIFTSRSNNEFVLTIKLPIIYI